jgi:tetratricopeptide (TPR) repeat protein
MKTSIFDSIAIWSLYLMAFLVPIGFFPWTVDVLEVNKQTILLLLSAVATLAWLGGMVKRKEAFFKKHSALFLGGSIALIAALSSFGSIGTYTSWVGNGLQAYTSTLSAVAFMLVLFVGAHYLHDIRVRYNAWFALLLASGVIALNTLAAMVGLPIFETNFIGTPNALALYLAVMAVIACGLWLVEGKAIGQALKKRGLIMHISMWLTVIAALFVSLSIDYWLIWVAILIGSGLLFAFAFFRAEEFPHLTRFMVPMVLFVIALLFVFFPSPISNVFSSEIAPSFESGWSIATQTLGESPFLGSGPGTFGLDYDQYRGTDANQTALWDARFDRAGQHWVTVLATMGVTGVVVLILLVLSLAATALQQLLQRESHEGWRMLLVAFIGWSMIVYGMMFYSSNMVLSFLFWFLSAMMLAHQVKDVAHWKFSTNPRGALATSFLFVLVNVGLLTLLFVTVSRYGSEIAFAKAVQGGQSGDELDQVILDLDSAARLNKLNDVYYRNLAHALLLKAGEIVADPNTTSQQLQNFITTSIKSAQRATELSPNDAQNWEVLGDLYLEVSEVLNNAATQAVAAYTEATLLAPANPKYFVALSRSYYAQVLELEVLMQGDDEDLAAQAEEARDATLALAVGATETAIELKENYATAYYQLALLLEAQGNLSEAITRMETLSAAYPNDVGVSFQLGFLYLRQGKMDAAETELLRTITLAPTYANAYWYLSSVYEDRGDFDAAIAAIEKVQELNPNSEPVIQRLERLRQGKTAAELPEPIEETEVLPTDGESEE